ncbi:MAG TPA: hypothetical protein VH351_19050 [Bryobacteraceae bacterium]|jgi:tetratricopeptide (TPR) repeat protein|nr:hypothetical protein [Bryobacteraceae bacterium]
MDWNVLFAVDHDSPYYNQPDKMAIFYAQSWALSHMLALGPNYSAGFPSFISTIASGTSTADALQKVYGKTVTELAADMQKYTNQSTVTGAVYDVVLTKAELDPQINDLSEFNVNLALAELLSTHPQTAAEAQERLAALEKQDPNDVELEVSMGYLAWEQNKLDETRRHFKNAVDHGLKDPVLLYKYALLIQGTGAPIETTQALLTETLRLQPENFEARMFLAGTELNAKQFGSTLATLAPVKTVAPDRAFEFFAMSANACANLKNYAAAKDNGRRAIKFARTPEQRQQMEDLLAFVEEASGAGANTTRAPEQPGVGVVTPEVMSARHAIVLAGAVNLPRVHGQTKFFDCANGVHRLHMQVNDREMVFALPADPGEVLVKNRSNVEFSCGTLKAESLTVVYKSSQDEKTDGTVAELVY